MDSLWISSSPMGIPSLPTSQGGVVEGDLLLATSGGASVELSNWALKKQHRSDERFHRDQQKIPSHCLVSLFPPILHNTPIVWSQRCFLLSHKPQAFWGCLIKVGKGLADLPHDRSIFQFESPMFHQYSMNVPFLLDLQIPGSFPGGLCQIIDPHGSPKFGGSPMWHPLVI